MTTQFMEISDQEFSQMRNLVYDRFGINLTEQKRSLLVTRLQKHIRSFGMQSFQAYYDLLVNDRSEKELGNLIDRISTNHTFFNREKEHFSFLMDTVLPEIVNRLQSQNQKEIRVWCAGCSSGEEAYMLLMLLHEFFGPEYKKWDAGILATDISNKALAAARAGIYKDDRVQSLPEKLRDKYFRKLPEGGYTVSDQLKNEATIRRFNLMNSSFPFKKPFHIIFCRNVMIYFDRVTRDNLVRKFYQSTEPQGYLFVGHSETLGRNNSFYRYVRPAAYQKETGNE